MPIEKRPASPLPKGPRPGSRNPPHRVVDDETLESVARKYGISVKQLIIHNFGTTNEAEINWYLREHVGCSLKTHDQKNWRFSRAANPGLIYIPAQAQILEMEPVEIVGHVPGKHPPPIDLNKSDSGSLVNSFKINYEFRIPPKEPAVAGYFLVQGKFNVEGELNHESGIVKFGFRPNLAKQIKASIEPKITDDTKATFAVKLEKKTLDPIIEAVKKRDSRGFRNALLAAFESTIKTTYKWGNISVVPEAGLELSKTPLIIKVAGSFEHRIPIDGATFKGKFTVKAGFNVGLSPQGWAWVAERVGAEAVKDFLVSSGERAMLFIEEWLLTEGVLTAGVVVAGALIGTLGLTCFMAWVTEDARHKGELEGLSTWYVSAYANRVFGDPTPSGFIVGDVALRDKLIDLGQRDAVQDARTYLRSVRDPAAAGSDQIALEAFRRILLVNDKNNYSTAKWRLQKSVEERAKKLAGL